MFTDMVNSVALKTKLGDKAYGEKVFGPHVAIFRTILADYKGAQEIKNTGDGFLVTFRVVSDAVNAALRLQLEMRSYSWEMDAPKTRIGIHVGEVAKGPQPGEIDIQGLAVDMCSRFMELAQGGQILLTRHAYDDGLQWVREHPRVPEGIKPMELRWLRHGRYSFKGKETDPLEVFEVGALGFAPFTRPPDSPKANRVREPEDQTPATVVDVAPALTLLQSSPSQWCRWLAASIIVLGVVCAGVLAYRKANPPQPVAQRNWKDRAEHDLYDAITKDTNPKTRLEKLQQWEKQYPQTDWINERQTLSLSTYFALADAKNAPVIAKQMLAEALAGNDPTPEVLDQGEKSANAMLANINTPPPNFTSEQWKSQRPQVEELAHRTLGWIAIQRKKWETAESELLLSLGIDPNNAEADHWLGSAMVADGRPEMQSQALYYFARAAAYEGPGAVPADERSGFLAQIREQYRAYHGSEAALDDLLEQAARKPSPPSDFKIMNRIEIARENTKRGGACANPCDAGSMAAIGQLYLAGDGVKKDYDEAMNWLRRAADGGSSFGMWKVGILYQNGWGAHRDHKEAKSWYTKAADAGEDRANVSIGLLYQHGWGVPKDYVEARRWYLKASAAGDSLAMSYIGKLYEQGGSGVSKDKDYAISWYRKAAAAGSVQAKDDLRRLHAQP
jgi:TPR repeat protein/class 3 adenylate cyclase